jgi:hypothetical protein
MSISQQQQHPPLHGADFGAGSSLPPPTIEAGPSRRPVRDGLNDVGISGPPFRLQQQQRQPSVHGGPRSSLPPPTTVEAGPSRRPVRDGLGLNDVGRSGPPFRARRRVAFTRHVSRIPRASASPPPPASLGFNHGSTRGASRVGPGMGHRGSVSVPNHHRHEGPVAVKFRLHRGANFGISVKQALDRERLSQSNNYLLQDIAPNMSRTIKLKVGVSLFLLSSYSPLSYYIIIIFPLINKTGCCMRGRVATT